MAGCTAKIVTGHKKGVRNDWHCLKAVPVESGAVPAALEEKTGGVERFARIAAYGTATEPSNRLEDLKGNMSSFMSLHKKKVWWVRPGRVP
jgi:hypothetical protein